MKQSRILAVALVGVLASAGVVSSQAQVVAGAAIGWGWIGYGPYMPYGRGPYGYGWIGLWGPCSAGACASNPYLRRAIQRELARLEFLHELEEHAQPDLPLNGNSLYGVRGERPPPTPEAQMQPAFRGSGDIRPEFSRTGQLRQGPAGEQRRDSN